MTTRGHHGIMMAEGAPAGVDPFFSNVVLLLNMEGTPGDNTFIDRSPLGRTMTAHGDVQIDDSLGYNAALFDSSGDYISTPYVKAYDDWWTGHVTNELWIHASAFTNWYYDSGGGLAAPSLGGCADPATDTNYWSLGPLQGGGNPLRFYYYNGARQTTDFGSVPNNAAVHIAMMHNADNNHLYLSVGGAVSDRGAVSGTPLSSAASPVLSVLGQINNRSIAGRVIAQRRTRALRYDLDGFTPDAFPFPTS